MCYLELYCYFKLSIASQIADLLFHCSTVCCKCQDKLAFNLASPAVYCWSSYWLFHNKTVHLKRPSMLFFWWTLLKLETCAHYNKLPTFTSTEALKCCVTCSAYAFPCNSQLLVHEPLSVSLISLSICLSVPRWYLKASDMLSSCEYLISHKKNL